MNKTNNTKQATWVALGSLFSFGFGIVSSMILSRYFDKGDYGTYKQVLFVYNTLLVVFTLGLPRAYSYFLPRVANEEAKSLIQKINTLFFLLGGVFSFLLFVGSSIIADLMNNENLEFALRIFSLVPLFMLPTMGLEAILATYKKTQFLAYYNIVTRLVSLICVCAPIILWNGGLTDALVGFLIASFFSFVVALYLKYLPVKDYKKETTSTTYKDIFNFSLPLLYASLWGVALKSTNQFFISRYYGTETFAEYSNGATELPFISMIIGSCSTVLSPMFSKIHHDGGNMKIQILPLWNSVIVKSAMLIYPLLLYSCFFSKEMMVILYGKSYELSYLYYCIISITNFFTIIVFAPFLIGIGKVRFYAKVHMFSAILLVMLQSIAVTLDSGPYTVVGLSMIVDIFKILVMLVAIKNYLTVNFLDVFPILDLSKIAILSISILLPVRILFSMLSISPIPSMSMSFLLFIIVYGLVAQISGLDYKRIITPLLNKSSK